MQKKTVNKNSREYLNKQIAGARGSLLAILLFTAMNLVLLVTDAGRYFLFSAAIPYYLTALGMGMDIGSGASGIGTFTMIMLVISVVILGMYLLCWLMSKKKAGWLVAALVLFVLDSAVLLLVALGLNVLTESIMDVVFHIWALVELIRAVIANSKLKKLPAETPVDINSCAIPAIGEDTEAFE